MHAPGRRFAVHDGPKPRIRTERRCFMWPIGSGCRLVWLVSAAPRRIRLPTLGFNGGQGCQVLLLRAALNSAQWSDRRTLILKLAEIAFIISTR